MTKKKTQSKTQTVNRQLITLNQSGQVMIIGLVVLAVVLILCAALFTKVASFLHFGANSILKEQAGHLAEAGIDYAIWQLNKTAGAYLGPETNKAVGTTGTFSLTITNKGSNLKTITATGYIPNSTNPRAKRTIKTDVGINNEVVVFNYGVQVGTGGFSINGGSTINGNVYSNANIDGNGGSHINGDAYAVGTITEQEWDLHVTGTKHPGSPLLPMPIENPATWYQQWKDAAAAGGTDSSNCTWDYHGGNRGPKKYACNITINGGGKYYIQGPIWITGNLTMNGGASLWLAESFGSNETVIIVDGTISISGGADIHSTTANPKGYILLATTSTSTSALSLTGGTQSSIFYILDGSATVSGGVRLTAIIAKQLNMTGGTILTYDMGLASSEFASGPGGSWQIKKGTYKFTNSP